MRAVSSSMLAVPAQPTSTLPSCFKRRGACWYKQCSYPAMLLAQQLVEQRYTIPGSLVHTNDFSQFHTPILDFMLQRCTGWTGIHVIAMQCNSFLGNGKIRPLNPEHAWGEFASKESVEQVQQYGAHDPLLVMRWRAPFLRSNISSIHFKKRTRVALVGEAKAKQQLLQS